MKHGHEDGYVLASVLAVLLSISLVAAALVSTSADGLKDVRVAEADAAADATLRSAILVVSAQLSLDPRRRQLDIDQAEPVVDVLNRTVAVRARWESSKLDVNLASPEDIESLLADAGTDGAVRSGVRAAVERYRAEEKQISLLDNVLPDAADSDCLHSIMTVFGGRPDYDPDNQTAAARIGRPAAGAMVAVEVWWKDEPQHSGLEAVLLMTGDPARPVEVLDWRSIRGGGKERCNVQA